MLFDSKVLADHIRNIHCSGLISEVILRRDLSATAVDATERLFVQAPALTIGRPRPLPASIGVADLAGLLRLLDELAAVHDEIHVKCDLERKRLSLSAGACTSAFFPIVRPREIGSKMLLVLVNEIEAYTNEPEATPVPPAVVSSMLAATRVIQCRQITFEMGPYGTLVRIGEPSGVHAEFRFGKFSGPEDCMLHFPANVVIAAMKRLATGTEPKLALLGPAPAIVLRHNRFSYLLQPEVEDWLS